MKFEWFLTKEELLEANASDLEDYICGRVYIYDDDKIYLADIYHERYSYAERCFDLEVYESNGKYEVGEWIGSIKDIKTATNLTRFKHRAEGLVEALLSQE